MATTTIDGLSRPRLVVVNRRDTPVWAMTEALGTTAPTNADETLPGDAVHVVRPSTHAARLIRVINVAVGAGEVTRGRPPPFSVGFIVAAQWTFFAAAAINLVLW